MKKPKEIKPEPVKLKGLGMSATPKKIKLKEKPSFANLMAKMKK
jgi:hypothetical protein